MLGLGEHVAHTAGTYADEHLYEIGTTHGEERYACFSCHGLGQQCLTRARRTDEQGAFGDLTSQIGVFLRVLEEVNNLLYLLLSSFLSGHILECDTHLVALFVELGFALAYIEHAATIGCVAHAPSEQPPKHDDKEHEWQEVEDDVPDVGIFLVVVAVASELVLLLLGVEEMLQLVDRTKLYGDGRVAANLLG